MIGPGRVSIDKQQKGNSMPLLCIDPISNLVEIVCLNGKEDCGSPITLVSPEFFTTTVLNSMVTTFHYHPSLLPPTPNSIIESCPHTANQII
jgi:hypothetical protein